MPEPCNITFSPYDALVNLPAHDVVAAHVYALSDQTFTSDTGETVRYIARWFIAPANRTFNNPDLPDLVAGHKYGVFRDCSSASGQDECPPLGACVFPNIDCCINLTEEECAGGEWQGPGTECPEGEECPKHPCCIGACIEISLPLCDMLGGLADPNSSTCLAGQPSASCLGACCIHLGVNGTICIPGTSEWECNNPVDSNLIVDPGGPFWPIWAGPRTCCPPPIEDPCPSGDFIDCPLTLPCCPSDGQNDLDCQDLEPQDCEAEDGTVGTIGLDCSTSQGICNGACCITQVDGQGEIIGGWCLDTSYDGCAEAGSGHQWTFLGPGTSCQENAGDCGICCKYDLSTDSFVCVEDLTQSECIEQCGRPFGPGSQCEICDNIKRACCVAVPSHPGTIPPTLDPEIGPGSIIGEFEPPFCRGPFECVDVNSAAECSAIQIEGQRGRYQPCKTCAGAPCEATGGACCTALISDPDFPDEGVCVCTDETRESCGGMGGSFWGEGTGCCTNPGGGGILPVCCVECPDFGGSAIGCGADAPPPTHEDDPPCEPFCPP